MFVSNQPYRASFEFELTFQNKKKILVSSLRTLLLVDMMNSISENQAISHKGEKCQKYSIEFKKRPLLDTLRKILPIVQQRNSKSIEKQYVSWSKRKRKKLTDVELEKKKF